MTSLIRTGGGLFDPAGQPIYFLASHALELTTAAKVHDYLLIAVNEISDGDLALIDGWIAAGKRVFVDSGIFALANQHAKAHGISMDRALALAPTEIDGFDALYARYMQIVTTYADRLWGYIELDQGGRENKIRTRARLESAGLRPTPVYHPLNDGWDYFDYLAQRYDRICIGNIVQADPATRRRLLATAWERHRRYPNLWIHLLGYTPSHILHAYPANSGDSSTWLRSVRWSEGQTEAACGQAISRLPENFRYRLNSQGNPVDGYPKAFTVSAYGASMVQRNWRHYRREMEDLEWVAFPPPTSQPAKRAPA